MIFTAISLSIVDKWYPCETDLKGATQLESLRGEESGTVNFRSGLHAAPALFGPGLPALAAHKRNHPPVILNKGLLRVIRRTDLAAQRARRVPA